MVVADAKLNFDDNAEYRQKQIFTKRDYTQEDPREVRQSLTKSSLANIVGGVKTTYHSASRSGLLQVTF